jgi:hypothetical protein
MVLVVKCSSSGAVKGRVQQGAVEIESWKETGTGHCSAAEQKRR